MTLNKIQKIALLLAYHEALLPVSEETLLSLIASVIEGTEGEGEDSIDWTPYLEFLGGLTGVLTEAATDAPASN